MALGTISVDSTELARYLVQALWVVTAVCGIVAGVALGFYYGASRVLAKVDRGSYQLGALKARATSRRERGYVREVAV